MRQRGAGPRKIAGFHVDKTLFRARPTRPKTPERNKLSPAHDAVKTYVAANNSPLGSPVVNPKRQELAKSVRKRRRFYEAIDAMTPKKIRRVARQIHERAIITDASAEEPFRTLDAAAEDEMPSMDDTPIETAVQTVQPAVAKVAKNPKASTKRRARKPVTMQGKLRKARR